tara:strand:+ start:407 stop:1435 length:1029 start_codon:yes stop_codon:yes gene_type:complete
MKYKQSNVTSKKGINFIRDIVESNGCLFHKIEQENDLGIDCIIEFTKDEKPMHKSIAAQIKSGNSYYDAKTNQCKIPVESHLEYWKNYPLPVFGFVYVPDLENAYFVNIKNYLEIQNGLKTIKFDCTKSNLADLDYFKKIFIPSILGDIPDLTLKETLSFFDSKNSRDNNLGSSVLFRRYKNEKITWDKLIDYVIYKEIENTDFKIIYYLSHIPWHPDIYHTGEILSEDIRNYVKEKIAKFDISIVIKLLGLINKDQGITRGSIGQSIEAILSIIKNIDLYLKEIILDENTATFVRENASEIYAYYNGVSSIEILKKVKSESEYISQIIEFLKKYKSYNLYQ